MNEQTPLDENINGPSEATSVDEVQPTRPAKQRKSTDFNLWQGLSTVLASALIVATLFTLWTPGSLVESSLEARMAQALEAASGEGEVLFNTIPDESTIPGWENIGIVAGHYGSDPGAVCPNNITEAELNLEIATLVQKTLSDQGYEVDLLQEFDSRLWGYQAAVLISIHLDSCEYINDQATGYKVAAALSAQNVADSQRLTQCLSEWYGEITGLPYHAGSVTDDMTYYHAFNEIDPRTNAAIIEAGFLNMDYRLLTEQTDLVADGIVAGILCYLNNELIQPAQSP